MSAQAYPLAWPEGWPRTPRKESSKFKATLSSALEFVHKELRLMGARSVVISSNVTLGTSRPAEPGVAVYFELNGDQMCIPCERYQKVEDNLQAIGKTIEALRGIERWGAKHMVKAAFRGFSALPSPAAIEDWRQVLGYEPGERPSIGHLTDRYRSLRSAQHPDKGGSAAQFHRIQAAFERAHAEIGG